MMKNLLFCKFIAVAGLVILFSCQQGKNSLESCQTLGVESVAVTPQVAFDRFFSAISANDTDKVLSAVVSRREMQALYPRQTDADPNPASAQVLPGFFHAENMKHLKRWFGMYAGVPLDSWVPGEADSVIQHDGFRIYSYSGMPDSLQIARSLVRCREGYKVWAVLDVRQNSRR